MSTEVMSRERRYSHKTNANLLLTHAIALHDGTSWRFCNSPAFGDFVKYVAEI